ncbi:MAG: hypothetical protein RLZZ08_1148, partial [Pseudomonadota bacterium]
HSLALEGERLEQLVGQFTLPPNPAMEETPHRAVIAAPPRTAYRRPRAINAHRALNGHASEHDQWSGF